MARRSAIVPHPLTNFITDNILQARHDARLTLRAPHVDSPQSTPNAVLPPQNSDISVADSSRISKDDPNDLHLSRLSNNVSFGFSFLDEPSEQHDMKRSPGEEDDDQENHQDDPYYTPPKHDSGPEINDALGRLLVFKDAPRHNRRGH